MKYLHLGYVSQPITVRAIELLQWLKPEERLQETSFSLGREWTYFPTSNSCSSITAVNREFLVKGGKFCHEIIKY